MIGGASINLRICDKQGASPAADQDVWTGVDLASAVASDSVSVGVEPAAWAALDLLNLPALLQSLGFNRRPLCCALRTRVGRKAKPGSERMTNRGRPLPRASDQRHAHCQTIAAHLFGAADTLFDIQKTTTVFHLAKIDVEGEARWQPQAQRGHSRKTLPGRIAATPRC